MLVGVANDYVLEGFWQKSERRGAWDRIASFGFECSTSFTYSVWGRNPRFDQIFNQERNFATHDYLLAHGIPSIPFVFFHGGRDYEEVVSWLNRRKDVLTVAMLGQFYESRSTFHELLEEMRALRRDTGRDLGFVVVGPSSADRIRPVLEQFPNSTIVTEQPVMKALMGQKTLPDLSHVSVTRAARSELAAANIAVFQKYCNRIGQKALTANRARKSVRKLGRIFHSPVPGGR
jgi:hypothetical protein